MKVEVWIEVSIFSCTFVFVLGTLAEWLLILQGVAEDRDMDMPKSCFKCRCQKAAKISIEMSDLQRVVGDAEMAYERAGMLEVPFNRILVELCHISC